MTPILSQQNCPVINEAQDILNCQQEITRKLRHFKTSLKNCRHCSQEGTCEGLSVFNNAIDQAIREVTEEWGL